MMSKAEEVIEWLRTTCDDPEDHTCEPCFQGNDTACEHKYLANIIEGKFLPANDDS